LCPWARWWSRRRAPGCRPCSSGCFLGARFPEKSKTGKMSLWVHF
jgi:hypothetical protein